MKKNFLFMMVLLFISSSAFAQTESLHAQNHQNRSRTPGQL